MNWKAVGKVLFFAGLGIFLFGQIQAAVFSSYYGVWHSVEELESVGFKIFDWFDDFSFAINSDIVGWPGLMIAGVALWIGGRKDVTA